MDRSSVKNETVSFLTELITDSTLAIDHYANNQAKKIANAPKHVLRHRISGHEPLVWLRYHLCVEHGTVPFSTERVTIITANLLTEQYRDCRPEEPQVREDLTAGRQLGENCLLGKKRNSSFFSQISRKNHCGATETSIFWRKWNCFIFAKKSHRFHSTGAPRTIFSQRNSTRKGSSRISHKFYSLLACKSTVVRKRKDRTQANWSGYYLFGQNGIVPFWPKRITKSTSKRLKG